MWHRGAGGRMTTKRDVTGWNDCLVVILARFAVQNFLEKRDNKMF
jgi:hypothetical protein